jgi:RNA polymerase sigma-70 factor (ECF subfamily)
VTGLPDPGPGTEDARRVARTLEGDAEAFGELYLAHAASVSRYVRLLVGDAALVEDITHDVFIRALTALPQLSEPSRFRAWLISIAHNAVSNHRRSMSRRPHGVPFTAPGDPEQGAPEEALGEIDHAFARADVRHDVERLIAASPNLTDAQRDVLALRFGAGLPLAETAALLGRGEDATKQLQYRALEVLRATARARESFE